MDPRKHILDAIAHWCDLANMIDPSVFSSNAALCQITLATCSEINYYFNGHGRWHAMATDQ